MERWWVLRLHRGRWQPLGWSCLLGPGANSWVSPYCCLGCFLTRTKTACRHSIWAMEPSETCKTLKTVRRESLSQFVGERGRSSNHLLASTLLVWLQHHQYCSHHNHCIIGYSSATVLHPSEMAFLSSSLSLTKPPAGEAAGAALPLVASEHAYIVSDIIPNLGIIPNLRCPDDSIYTKACHGSRFLSTWLWIPTRCKTTPSTWELLRRTQGSGKPNLGLLLASLTSTWNPTCPIWKQFTGNQWQSWLIRI